MGQGPEHADPCPQGTESFSLLWLCYQGSGGGQGRRIPLPLPTNNLLQPRSFLIQVLPFGTF